MKPKNLIVLSIITLLLICLAFFTSHRREKEVIPPSDIGQPVFKILQDLEQLNSITKLVFISSSGTTVIEKVQNKWVTPSRFNYPVDENNVFSFIKTVADLKIQEIYEPDPILLSELNLTRPEAGAMGGTWVQLFNEYGHIICEFIAGKDRMRQSASSIEIINDFSYSDGRYIAYNEKIYGVGNTLSSIPSTPVAWCDKNIVNVFSADVKEILLKDPAGQAIKLIRDKNNNFILPDIKEDEEMKIDRVNKVTTMLNYMAFNDIADPSLTEEQTGLKSPWIFTMTTKDGITYTMLIGSNVTNTTDRYVKFYSNFNPELVEKTEEKKEIKEGEKSQEKKPEDRAAEILKATQEFNEKHEKWIYIISSWKVGDLSINRSDYVNKKSPPENKSSAEKSDAEANPQES